MVQRRLHNLSFSIQNQSAASSVRSFGGDVDVNKFLPGLIETLTHDDQIIVDAALMSAHKFSQKDDPLRAMGTSPPLIKALMNQMWLARQGCQREIFVT